jgi:hypothetical protein
MRRPCGVARSSGSSSWCCKDAGAVVAVDLAVEDESESEGEGENEEAL